MEGKVILLKDFNDHSLEWNLHCGERRDTAGLKTLIERHDLILNNEPGKVTRLTHWTTTAINNLKFTTTDIGELDSWIID